MRNDSDTAWILVKTAPLRKGLNRNGPNRNGPNRNGLTKLSRLPKRPHKNGLNRNGLNRNGPTGWWSQTKTAPSKICTYYLGYRNGLTKTASTETAPRDDGAKPKRPHLKFASIIHGLDNIRTKIVSFKEKVKKLDTALFKNSYLLLTQNQNRNGPISNLQAEAYIYGLDNTHATIVSFIYICYVCIQRNILNGAASFYFQRNICCHYF